MTKDVSSFLNIKLQVEAICGERDLALWFFEQNNLTIKRCESAGGGRHSWVVKREEEIIGHSWGTPWDAIHSARRKLDAQERQNLRRGTNER